MKDCFVFHRRFYEAVKELPSNVQCEIYNAIMDYALNGVEMENLQPVSRSVFALIKPMLDVDVGDKKKPPTANYSTYDEFLKWLLESNSIKLEGFCVSNHITPKDFKRYAENVITDWKLYERDISNQQEAIRHLLNTVRCIYQKEKQNNENSRRGTCGNTKKPQTGKGFGLVEG